MSTKAFSLRVFSVAFLVALGIGYPAWISGGLLRLGIGLGLIIWMSLTTLASYAWVNSSIQAPGPVFINRILSVTMGRLILGIMILVSLFYFFPEEKWFCVLLYFFCFICGTAFEIAVLLRNLRDISKK